MDLDLTGRVVLVTGGSSGIGRATVWSLLEEARWSPPAGVTPLASMSCARPSMKAGFLVRSADVLAAVDMEALVLATVTHFGRLDGFFANAGHGSRGGAFDATANDWEKEFTRKIHSIMHAPPGSQAPRPFRCTPSCHGDGAHRAQPSHPDGSRLCEQGCG